MAYIDDLGTPRQRRKPAILGAISTLTTPTPAPTTTAAAGGGVAVPRPPTTPATPTTPAPTTPADPYRPPPTRTPNSGVSGTDTSQGGVPPPPVVSATPARTAENNPGLDPAKWLAGHTSPKYAFHEVAKKYDQRTDAGRAQTLAELQRVYPQWFNGWTIAGDKLRYGGDPSQLQGEWDGYNEFDAWYGSKAGVWSPQWIPSQRYGQAYVDPAAAAQSAAAAGSGATGTGSAATGAGAVPGAGGGATPGQSGLQLDPLSGLLGGSGGLDFGVDGPFGYDDPNTRQLEEFLRMLIDEKVKPIDDPARNEYANALRQRFQSLIAPGSGANAGATALDQQLQDAINQLTNPALTENDRSRLENRALEPMERDRQIRLQQQKERMAAMGHGESSGTIVDALGMVDQDFDRRRGEVQRDLSIYEREQEDARRREAIDFGTQRRNVIGTELDREQGRYGQALTMAEALSNLSGQQRGEQDARMREALTYVSLFPEMDERRLRLAMETLGMSNSMANTPSIFNTLSNLQAQANASAQQGQQANAQFWGQMGQWMANAWPKDGGA